MNQTIAYYDKYAKEFCQTTRNADMSFCRNKFLNFLNEGAHILDAGCGSGRDAKAFLEAGYQVTAFDASQNICKEAETLLRQKVFCLSFEELEFKQEFDGIWACASLLHVSHTKMNDVLERLWAVLKNNGILYASFKYGEGEHVRNGRFFCDYKENALQELFVKNHFVIKEMFLTQDVRKNRETEQWLNVLAGKF